MRTLALFSLLCMVAATVLTALLIAAGNRPNFLESVNLLTLNTTQVGSTFVSSSSSPIATLTSNPGVSLVIATNPTASVVAFTVENEANTIAEEIGLHDWYSLHLLDYCEGYYHNTSSDVTKNVTSCSNATSLWSFNLTTLIQNELRPGITLADINFPSAIQEDLQVFETAMKVTFIFYCVACGLNAIGVITAIIGLFFDGRISACLNVMWVTLDVLVTAVASVIATVVMVKVVDEVNGYTNQVGIVATKGNQFLAMTWAAVGVLILAWLTWLVDCCVGGSRKTRLSAYRERYWRDVAGQLGPKA